MSKRRWTRALVLGAIERWVQEHGEPPAASEWKPMTRPEWVPHASTVIHMFGSFGDALRVLGYEPRYAGPWTGDDIVTAIRRWVAEHGSPPKCMDFDGRPDLPNASTIATHFGSWNEAIAEAGFAPRPRGRPRKLAA